MGVNITYMGTKRTLAPMVRDIVHNAQAGVLLDAFSGMCSVGEAVGTCRQIWNNDAQIFASVVARALFKSRNSPPSPLSYGDIHFEKFERQRKLLEQSFSNSLSIENELLNAGNYSNFTTLLGRLKEALQEESTRCRLRSPHLFSSIYSGTFFGVHQAVEADSIVASLRGAKSEART